MVINSELKMMVVGNLDPIHGEKQSLIIQRFFVIQQYLGPVPVGLLMDNCTTSKFKLFF